MSGAAKLAVLGVRDLVDGSPVELWLNQSDQVVVRAYNEGGYCFTKVPLLELMAELKGVGLGVQDREQITN